jgi:hypothetical protein
MRAATIAAVWRGRGEEMSWTRAIRALTGRAGSERPMPNTPVDDEAPRSYFIGVDGRPMRLTLVELTPEAILDATEAGEHPLRKASGALQLRGLARVNGQLVALHDVEGTARAERRPEEHQAISS